MRTRRRFSAEFKAKVALEAIKGHETVSELAAYERHGLHPTQIAAWKREAVEKLARVLVSARSAADLSGRLPRSHGNCDVTRPLGAEVSTTVQLQPSGMPSVRQPPEAGEAGWFNRALRTYVQDRLGGHGRCARWDGDTRTQRRLERSTTWASETPPVGKSMEPRAD